LPFLLALHDAHEDQHFLSTIVLPTHHVWLAEVDRQPVGHIAFSADWVHHPYIAPQFQRRGLGQRLLDIAKTASPVLKLWVFQVNTPAIQFYERQGFHIIERTAGASNEARMPDLLMEWKGPAHSAPQL